MLIKACLRIARFLATLLPANCVSNIHTQVHWSQSDLVVITIQTSWSTIDANWEQMFWIVFYVYYRLPTESFSMRFLFSSWIKPANRNSFMCNWKKFGWNRKQRRSTIRMIHLWLILVWKIINHEINTSRFRFSTTVIWCSCEFYFHRWLRWRVVTLYRNNVNLSISEFTYGKFVNGMRLREMRKT